jgi:hypothetical protein
LPVFDGRALALDETAEVKEEDVRNKSTKLMGRMNKIKAFAQSISIKLKQMLEVENGSKRIYFGLYE